MENNDAPVLVNEDYSTARKPRPVRVPERLYEDFTKTLPFGISYAAMMINLMVYYLHTKEAVHDFLANTKISKDTNTSDAG